MGNEEKAALSQAISAGIEAQKLLDNQLLSLIIFTEKNAACTAFMNTNPNDDAARKQLWVDVRGVIALERKLQELVEAGNIAKNQLEEADRLKQPNYNPIHRAN